MPGIGWYTFSPNTREAEQEDGEYQASLGYRTKTYSLKKKKGVRGWGKRFRAYVRDRAQACMKPG